MSDSEGFLYLAILIAVYLAPTIVAMRRDHRDTPAIFIVNLLLGWTLLGWVVALAWAFMDRRHSRDPVEEPRRWRQQDRR